MGADLLGVDLNNARDELGLFQLGLGLADHLLVFVCIDNGANNHTIKSDLGLNGLDGMEHNGLL
jgi:hypothetical protein